MGRDEGCGRQIVIVDDDASFRSFVDALLGGEGYDVVQAGDAAEALAILRAGLPDLILLDVLLPGISGYEVCRTIRQELGDDPPIVFLSGERRESYDRVAGLLLGADDYLVKPVAPDELLARVRCLLRRGAPVRGSLTVREQQVLELLAEGLNQETIASRLVISPKTVATHVERILSKLGAHSRAEAVALAYRRRLVPVRS